MTKFNTTVFAVTAFGVDPHATVWKPYWKIELADGAIAFGVDSLDEAMRYFPGAKCVVTVEPIRE